MRFITLFSGALVATTAVNILLASDAHAGFPPNGWEQVGKSCDGDQKYTNNTYTKLRKKSDNSKYGIWRNKDKSNGGSWQQKGIPFGKTNNKMNDFCGLCHNQAAVWTHCY